MARRLQIPIDVSKVKERSKRWIRRAVRLVPIVIVVAAIAWFFLLRSPGGQTTTSSSTDPADTLPETTVSAAPGAQPETEVADNSTMAQPTTEKEGKLPETGSAETLAIFAITAAGGTLFWEWRLRRNPN